MAYFPFFIEVKDKVCVVVGGGRIAFRKIEILARFDAKIIVIAANICDEIYALKKATDEKATDVTSSDVKSHGETEQIMLLKKEYRDEDILEADFVVAATDDTILNSHIAELCKKRNTLVNVVDVKEECSFVFPAIVKKDELVVAISTGGNSPAMASKIRKNMQRAIPDYYGALVETLGEYRDYIKKEIEIPEHRKQAYKELIHLAELQEANITFELIQDIVQKYR